MEQSRDELPAARDERLDQVPLEVRPRRRSDLGRSRAHLPRVLEVQTDETPLCLVRQPRPEPLEDDGNPNPSAAATASPGVSAAVSPQPGFRMPSALPWTPPRSVHSGLPPWPPDQLRCVHRIFLFPLSPVPSPAVKAPDAPPAFSGPRPGHCAAARRLQDLPVFLVDHPPVEFGKLLQHRLLLRSREIHEDGKKNCLSSFSMWRG